MVLVIEPKFKIYYYPEDLWKGDAREISFILKDLFILLAEGPNDINLFGNIPYIGPPNDWAFGQLDDLGPNWAFGQNRLQNKKVRWPLVDREELKTQKSLLIGKPSPRLFHKKRRNLFKEPKAPQLRLKKTQFLKFLKILGQLRELKFKRYISWPKEAPSCWS